jgi:ADP-ribose pyrophosphatase
MPVQPQEETLSSERKYEGKVVSLRVDTIRMANGRTVQREVVEHRPAVAIVPLTSAGKVILVRQERTPVGAALLEVPAGVIERDEDPEQGAQRELQEEIGMRAGRMERLAGFWVAPGYTTEYIHVYLATDLTPSRLRGDDDEHIMVEEHALEDALAMIARGELADAKTIVGLLMAAVRLRGLSF